MFCVHDAKVEAWLLTEKWPFLRLVLARFSERKNIVHVAEAVDLSKLDDYMKTYVLTLSRHFLANHKRAWEETHLKEKFLLGQGCPDCASPQDLSGINISDCNSCVRAYSLPKLHAVRANYPLWAKRIKEVQAGRAVLSVRQWTGKPYAGQQEEIAKLTAADGIGIQRLDIFDLMRPVKVDGRLVYLMDLAHNDGLSFSDWYDRFRLANVKKPMAIIHFTKFRY